MSTVKEILIKVRDTTTLADWLKYEGPYKFMAEYRHSFQLYTNGKTLAQALQHKRKKEQWARCDDSCTTRQAYDIISTIVKDMGVPISNWQEMFTQNYMDKFLYSLDEVIGKM